MVRVMGRVVVGMDPHKRSATIEVPDVRCLRRSVIGEPLVATVRFRGLVRGEDVVRVLCRQPRGGEQTIVFPSK